MNALTNAQIEARKTPAQLAAERGQKAQVSTMVELKRAYRLVRGTGAETNQAELRDNASGDKVVYSGTYTECVAEAKRRGLWVGTK